MVGCRRRAACASIAAATAAAAILGRCSHARRLALMSKASIRPVLPIIAARWLVLLPGAEQASMQCEPAGGSSAGAGMQLACGREAEGEAKGEGERERGGGKGQSSSMRKGPGVGGAVVRI